LGLWYIDINVNVHLLYGFGITFGAMIGREGLYPYVGGGLVSPPASISITWSPYDPTPAWNKGIQIGIPKLWVGGQKGYSYENCQDYWEVGFATPGVTVTEFYVWGPVNYTWEVPDIPNTDRGPIIYW